MRQRNTHMPQPEKKNCICARNGQQAVGTPSMGRKQKSNQTNNLFNTGLSNTLFPQEKYNILFSLKF